ncbi:hypothetical protein A3C21_00080 [Candidatus Kaiserbacteria bacterium RIFCSPHIGHO2_02_FULL_59_21]|uniref:Uncharacterized protein n=1 Tax=Candidatus Kaiserbacteria bacterium RIFCSPHIGHO2_02_FULL_59_21 TaxID=1798500 RepID=A0A1F6E1H0_9BACT|nr:MAG: hypothetical protein A2766_00915 [Candidatus Kaiserbacteria bacterium RIFCSPHIGHO2_01_FULL_58_22]OGG67486.1 MAG: hypothetical protein A3C21_00080 [Candidatus Kaiserbacteria bacterium RIFCSPHIGHO2_02_FULL_59_21]OGG80103.1 MAG: hypothetical protein A2952_03385 [Candidatus Kaiserbacteria bacterium RIFCSPLOWO2_01_FULL_59_34]OGG86894.1 MAG: hypothetical protein A3I47_02775 [Candidatus Kaiserbacteria bacterium RIFCSPLOWO2_02_FULL_59_19]
MKEKPNEGPVRSQKGLSVSADRLEYNFLDKEVENPYALIREESLKIENPRIRHLYVTRALYNIGDPKGRMLTIEELDLLNKYVTGEYLTDEDLKLLDTLVPDTDAK